jgi:hypothetical protein
MNDNKFKLRKLARWREESEEMFRVIGLRPAQYADLIGELADIGTERIVSQASQFLFDFKECGPNAMAERHEVSRATAYERRSFALHIVSSFATGN